MHFQEMSADWYTGAKAEFKTGDEEGEFKPCENGNSCTTVRDHLAPIRTVLDPIFEEHGVDFCETVHCDAPLCRMQCHVYNPPPVLLRR